MRSSGIFLSVAIAFLLSCINLERILAQEQALLIIDIQYFYFPGGDMALVDPEKAASNAGILLDHFRERDDLVLHVRHNYSPGGEIYDLVKPLNDEYVLTKNEVNAFLGTSLDSILKANSIMELVLCGMQTHMCMEAATRAAADLGYNCIVVEDACATRNLKYGDKLVAASDVHLSTLATLRSYAKIITTLEYLEGVHLERQY